VRRAFICAALRGGSPQIGERSKPRQQGDGGLCLEPLRTGAFTTTSLLVLVQADREHWMCDSLYSLCRRQTARTRYRKCLIGRTDKVVLTRRPRPREGPCDADARRPSRVAAVARDGECCSARLRSIEAWARYREIPTDSSGAREVKSSSSTRLPPVPDCRAKFADKRQL
jgi:hypothetical protein